MLLRIHRQNKPLVNGKVYLPFIFALYYNRTKAIPHNSKCRYGGSPRQEPPQAAVALRSARCGSVCGTASALPNARYVGLRYPHRASGAKSPSHSATAAPASVRCSATGGAHLCSIQYYLLLWLSSCRTSLAVSALRIMRYCLVHILFYYIIVPAKMKHLTPDEQTYLRFV